MKSVRHRGLAALQQQILAGPCWFLLIPISWLYAAGVAIRNGLYALGVFKTRRLPCRVISIGNLAAGGTGKTPAVIAIAKKLQRADLRAAILLRGYKRQSREKVTIVSDGENVCVSVRESGDEAYMLASHLCGIPVLVGRQRYLAGRVALERFNVDVLLLDDGFQHRQLERDVDILTVPTPAIARLNTGPRHTDRNRERLLPAGTLREPPTALRRAHIILLTHVDSTDVPPHVRKYLKRLAPGTLILESVHKAVRLYPLGRQKNGTEANLCPAVNVLHGKRILAVCGIGNPAGFVATLGHYSPERVDLLAFPDHHRYTTADLSRIYTTFQTVQADLIVTTQKDEPKLTSLFIHREPLILVLEIEMVITKGREQLIEVLTSPR